MKIYSPAPFKRGGREGKNYDKMVAVRLCLVANAQIIQSNTGKQFFTSKPNRKTERKLISISQSIVFHFF